MEDAFLRNRKVWVERVVRLISTRSTLAGYVKDLPELDIAEMFPTNVEEQQKVSVALSRLVSLASFIKPLFDHALRKLLRASLHRADVHLEVTEYAIRENIDGW